MFRVGIITDKGEILSRNFDTKDEVDDFLLAIMEKQGVKFYKIKNRKTGEILETEKKKYKNE